MRAEFEKTARELDASFVERARRVADRLDEKVDEVFGPEHGHVTKALERHFGDESSVAVQHQVRALLGEAAVQLRDDLRRQFSADGDANPLAGFQNAHLAATKQMADQQAGTLRAMAEKLEAMKLEISELRSEKQRLAEIAAVVEKGTAKGRTYEEAVALAIDAIASAQGDDCEAVGDVRGEGGRKGDVVVAIDACAGPARRRIVFEAKNSQLSRNRALAELDAALKTRGADFAIFVVPSEDKLPARTRPLREFNGDKMFVVYDAEDDARLALEVVRPGPGAGPDEPRRGRVGGPGGGAGRGRAGDRRDGGRAPHQDAAHERQRRDRGGAQDPRCDGKRRAQSARCDRAAARGGRRAREDAAGDALARRRRAPRPPPRRAPARHAQIPPGRLLPSTHARAVRRSSSGRDRPPLSRGLVLLLAIACGSAVANLYYVQPLLNVVGEAFGVSEARAGLLVTCAQAGYLLGLAFLGPLGDLVERRPPRHRPARGRGRGRPRRAPPRRRRPSRRRARRGRRDVRRAMILVPLAATLAGPERRGQVVGTVMSGLLVGILLSRTLSGLVAEVGGWRLVFALAAVGMLVLAFALRRGLPPVAPTEQLRYRELLRSVLALVAAEPVLRQRMALGALAFGGFAVLWTSIAFMLAKPPYGYGEGVIGLFGLAGLAGAFAAPVAGRLADRGRDRASLAILLVATLASWGLLTLGASSLVALIVGLVVFDAGIQGSHINNQDAVNRLRPEARSRMTTAYMVSFFAGGVLGSMLSATVYAAAGWDATCALGAGFALVALVVARRPRGAAPERARGGRAQVGK